MADRVASHYSENFKLADAIADKLRSTGKDLNKLTTTDLAAVDEFHIRGRKATLELSEKMNLNARSHVLDIGSGLGGPARTLAETYSCRVTGVDLTQAFCDAATAMSDWVGLGGRVSFKQGDAINLSFDMTALVLVFADNDGGFDVIPFCWLPGETLQEREDEDNVHYRLWARDEYLLTFPGRSTDPKAVALKIAELHGLCNIKALAFDRWRIEDIKRELDAIGCHVELMPFGQGYKDISPAVDTLERLVEQGKLRHDNHPVLSMAAANAKVEMDAAGNRKLSKRKSTGRIDPLLALTMAVGVAGRPGPTIDVRALIG